MDSQVSIIILNYNWKQFNQNCINSLLQQTYTQFEIIFVNNASDDGSCEEVKTLFHNEIVAQKIRIIEPWINLWFAWGNNAWAMASSHDAQYICLLNNDTILPSDWLMNLVLWIQSDKHLWAVGSVIYDQWYEEEMRDFLFKKQKKWINNYFFDSVIVEQTEEDKQGTIIYTTWVSWCCLLYKKELLDKPFDEIYFAYMEDTALCLKIILQWYRVGMVKNSIVHHFWSGSFGKKPSIFKVFHGIKNYMLNFIILSQWWYRIVILPWFVLGILIRTLVNYQTIRIQWLRKAVAWIVSHRTQIQSLRKNGITTIHTKDFYSQLWADFLCVPFYVKSSLYKKVIIGINSISRLYFSLFGYIFSWLGR
jgi:GT2 family glycosyltransferase